jgi:hypothetical protein
VGVSRSDPFNEGPVAARARRRRNYAIALGLIAFMVIIFATTAIRLVQNTRADPAAGEAAAGSVPTNE